MAGRKIRRGLSESESAGNRYSPHLTFPKAPNPAFKSPVSTSTSHASSTAPETCQPTPAKSVPATPASQIFSPVPAASSLGGRSLRARTDVQITPFSTEKATHKQFLANSGTPAKSVPATPASQIFSPVSAASNLGGRSLRARTDVQKAPFSIEKATYKQILSNSRLRDAASPPSDLQRQPRTRTSFAPDVESSDESEDEDVHRKTRKRIRFAPDVESSDESEDEDVHRKTRKSSRLAPDVESSDESEDDETCDCTSDCASDCTSDCGSDAFVADEDEDDDGEPDPEIEIEEEILDDFVQPPEESEDTLNERTALCKERIARAMARLTVSDFTAIDVGKSIPAKDQAVSPDDPLLRAFEDNMRHCITIRKQQAEAMTFPVTKNDPMNLVTCNIFRQGSVDSIWRPLRDSISPHRRRVLGATHLGLAEIDQLPAPTNEELHGWFIYLDYVEPPPAPPSISEAELDGGDDEPDYLYTGSGTGANGGISRWWGYERAKRLTESGTRPSEVDRSYHLKVACRKGTKMHLRVIAGLDRSKIAPKMAIIFEGLCMDYLRTIDVGYTGFYHTAIQAVAADEACPPVRSCPPHGGLNHASPLIQGARHTTAFGKCSNDRHYCSKDGKLRTSFVFGEFCLLCRKCCVSLYCFKQKWKHGPSKSREDWEAQRRVTYLNFDRKHMENIDWICPCCMKRKEVDNAGILSKTWRAPKSAFLLDGADTRIICRRCANKWESATTNAQTFAENRRVAGPGKRSPFRNHLRTLDWTCSCCLTRKEVDDGADISTKWDRPNPALLLDGADIQVICKACQQRWSKESATTNAQAFAERRRVARSGPRIRTGLPASSLRNHLENLDWTCSCCLKRKEVDVDNGVDILTKWRRSKKAFLLNGADTQVICKACQQLWGKESATTNAHAFAERRRG